MNPQSVYVAPQENMAEVGQYTGYVPKTPGDFVFYAKDAVQDAAEAVGDEPGEGKTDQGELETRSRGKLIYLILMGSFVAFFIITISFSIFGAECKLGLCKRTDKSSLLDAKYESSLFSFTAPLKYVWASFAVSTLGMAIFSLLGFFLFKIDHMQHGIKKIALHIRTEGLKFLLSETVFVLCLIVIIFTLTAVQQLWRLGGGFILGTIFASLLMLVVAFLTNEGSYLAAALGQDSVQGCFYAALRSGSMVSLLVVSVSVGGLSFAYLVLQDVRSLSGYVLGIACVAIVARVAGGFYKKASQVAESADWLCSVGRSKTTPWLTPSAVGNILGNASGMSVDVMGTFVATTVATAILGAHAPYFSDNPYAMCVYNHLSLDQTCTIVDERGSKVSLSATVCRLENFYSEYPSLTTWQSNSLFVALPFILGLIALLISAVCSLHFILPRTDELPADCEHRLKLSKSVTYRVSLNVLLSVFLMIVCSAGVCWSLFGVNSSFGKGQSIELSRQELPPLTADNADDRCIPVQTQDGTGRTRLPSLRVVRGRYQPLNSLGDLYPPTSQVAWRLFVCILLGCISGIVFGVMVDWCDESVRFQRNERAAGLDRGRGALTTDALGRGMVATTAPVAILVTLMSVSFKLHGSYGVGLCAMGLLSSAGPIIAFQAMGPIAETAAAVASSPDISILAWKATDFVSLVASKLNSVSRGVLSGSGFLSAFTLISVVVLESGLVPSPKQLAGTLDSRPSKHITDFKGISALDVYVFTSAVMGTLVPCVFSAFILLSGSYTDASIMAHVRPNTGDDSVSKEANHIAQNISDRHQGYTMLLSGLSLWNAAALLVFAVMIPLIVGFGFGQRALIALTVSAISMAFILSTAMTNTGSSLARLRKVLESGRRSFSSSLLQWAEAARTGDVFGNSLINCCAPALLALMKFLSAIAVLIIPMPPTSIQRGWIGIILCCASAFILALVVFCARRWKQARGASGSRGETFHQEEERGEPALNPNFVSPFFEEGPCLPVSHVHPQSDLAVAYENCDSVGFGGDIGFDDWVPMVHADSGPEVRIEQGRGV